MRLIDVDALKSRIERMWKSRQLTNTKYKTFIELLDAEPTIEPEIIYPETIADLISRQAAIDAINHICPVDTEYDCTLLDRVDVRYVLSDLPSAQPEIIACRDCKHYICHDRRCGYWNHGVEPLDWCCHAERRTDEADRCR